MNMQPQTIYSINAYIPTCISSSALVLQHQCQTILDDVQEDDMRIKRTVLPDGTSKLTVDKEELQEQIKKPGKWSEYRKYLRETTPEQRCNINLERRFWKKVDKKSDDKCWNWTGSMNSHGYGNSWLNGKSIRAHQLSYILYSGKIPDSMNVLHTCDNRKCVNPKHLFLGTCQDNMRDMIDKGRGNNTKLTWKNVREIRILYKTGQYSQNKLAKMFNVSRWVIQDVINNKTWKTKK